MPESLYTLPTIDCRTCGRYWPGKNKCSATVVCNGGDQYKISTPVLLFMRLDDEPPVFVTPNVRAETPTPAQQR